jgi:hypothetical protein
MVTLPPDSFAAGSVLQLVSAETGEPIDGAAVTVGGRSYTSAGGRVTLQDRVPLRSEIGIVAPGMLERYTLVRDAAATRFGLWPARSPTGMDEGYTQALIYSHGGGGRTPMRRLARNTTRVVVVLAPDLRADERVLAEHQEAVDRMNAATGGQVVYALGTQVPATGGYVEARLDANDDTCDEPGVLAFEQDYVRGFEIAHSVIVYCDPKAARTATVSHEMGHTFGIFHSPDKAELMYAYYNGHGGVDFSPREALEMRLMLQRPAGNLYPDDDRTAVAAGSAPERIVETVCRTSPR